ncbi:helix-turn-helix domain-containing protein [Nocardioides alcanivorans]|uniref:helix-turn-helix domain-containing protein n=1 Tax=Nocardioides alcanivorans TaxID=2897352 RepID=UPI001F259A03|nr:helix-turn-helix transcriptional regulator [Nocardioides alcanivorans]
MLLGKKVEAAREARGLTQGELITLSQISRSNIQNILYARFYAGGEPSPSYPKLDTIFKLALALRVEMSYLTDWKHPVEPVPPPTPPEGEPPAPS